MTMDVDPWKGAIALMLLSQVMAAFVGYAVTRACISGNILEIIIVSWVAALGAAGAVAGGYCAVKLARASRTKET